MRKFAVLFAALAFSGSAFAADMAVKAPSPAPAPTASSWTGFYLGGDVGGAWTHTSLGISDPNNTLGLTGGLVPINFNSSASSASSKAVTSRLPPLI
jgi:outer membrane immunogenic protein